MAKKHTYEHPNIPQDKLEGVSFQWLRLQCATVERLEALNDNVCALNATMNKVADAIQDAAPRRRRRRT